MTEQKHDDACGASRSDAGLGGVKPKPGFAPIYCGMYPELAELAREHGYAMAIHGSLKRDFDLICVPWIENPSEPEAVVSAIEQKFALRRAGPPDTTWHGRERWTMVISFGTCFIDLQFMPKLQKRGDDRDVLREWMDPLGVVYAKPPNG